MIYFLNLLSSILEWGYVFVFFWILHTFLPVRRSWFLRVPAFFACSFFAVVIIYSNDLANLLGSLIGFSLYLILFHRGRWVENNALPDTDTSGKTTKEDTLFHGFGLSNIRAASEKYDGQCTVKCEGGVFVLKVMIPVEGD